MRTVISASLLLLSACLSVDPPEGRLACSEANVTHDCPGGWSCVDGLCYKAPHEGAGRDAAVDLDGAVASDGEVTGDGGAKADAQVAVDAGPECTSAAECDDHTACSVDTCEDNTCRHAFMPNDQPDLPDPSGADENCDGADGVVTRDLYVAPGASGSGAWNDPASFEAALGAFAGDQYILVATGEYAVAAPLMAPDGVRIHGGYAPNFRSRPGATRVLSSANQALIIRDVTAATIEQVDWETADGASSGAHTQTITVINASGVVLRNLAIAAGDGAAGADGATGAAGSLSGPMGLNGENGNGVLGGAGASCGTAGGQGGGTNGPQVAGNSAAIVGTGCGHGGPAGGNVNDNRSCTTGSTYVAGPNQRGTIGEPGCPQLGRGAVGAGGSGVGAIAASGLWSGVDGEKGGKGPLGNAGGGGGGGAPYFRNMCASSAGGGGGGGCGGGGGDGGSGGEPGRSGGASIAMVVQDSTLTLDNVTVHTGAGGNGGQGGDGGPGAAGVPGSGGGIGGTVSGTSSTKHQGGSGGAGGDGSTGGAGGCGGGGSGGWSIGVFVVGASTLDPQSVTYDICQEVSGGGACPAAASNGALGNAGAVGMALEVLGP
jgi:hypothetical protein